MLKLFKQYKYVVYCSSFGIISTVLANRVYYASMVDLSLSMGRVSVAGFLASSGGLLGVVDSMTGTDDDDLQESASDSAQSKKTRRKNKAVTIRFTLSL